MSMPRPVDDHEPTPQELAWFETLPEKFMIIINKDRKYSGEKKLINETSLQLINLDNQNDKPIIHIGVIYKLVQDEGATIIEQSGGKKKSRKSRRSRKSRKSKKSRKSRKSRK